MDKTTIITKRIEKDWKTTVADMNRDLWTMCWVDDKFFYFTKKKIVRVEKKLTKHEAAFEKFWDMYPRKVWKKPTEIKFMLLNEKQFDSIFAWLEQHLKQWDDRIKTNNKEFIPVPHTRLNQERWTDEIEIWEKAKNSIYRDRLEAEKKDKAKKDHLAKIELEKKKKEIQDKILELWKNDPNRLERIKNSIKENILNKNPNAKGTFYENLFNIGLKAKIAEIYFSNKRIHREYFNK